MMAKLFLASGNQGKLREIQALLNGISIELITPSQMGIELFVEEDGSTYEENAARKAVAFAREAKMLTLADDSGLEVDALGGAPGIHSARFSPLPGATDADRRAYLLTELMNKSRPWIAHFHCTVVLASPAAEIYIAQGDCPGEIIPEERGLNGFGYDPIFMLPNLGKTMAELSMEDKNRISHRAKAVMASLPILLNLLNPYRFPDRPF
jgi:XTP/dITP diphosphohydrolase